jgi:hypothetical protein
MSLSLISFIKSWDFFGESFTFKVKRQKYYTSIVGGLASIGFLVYSLYYIIWSLFDFFGKRDRSLESEIKSISELHVNFTNHEYFKLVMCYRHPSMAVDTKLREISNIDSHIVDDELKLKRLESTKDIVIKSNCTESFPRDEMKEFFSLESFEDCDCLSFTGRESFRSKFSVVDKKYLDLKFSLNSIEDQMYLEKTSSRLFVYFPSYSIDSKNLENPLKMNIHTEIFDLKPQVEQKSEIFLSVLNFTDYNSLYDESNIFFIFRQCH